MCFVFVFFFNVKPTNKKHVELHLDISINILNEEPGKHSDLPKKRSGQGKRYSHSPTQTIHLWYIYLHEWLIFMVNVGKYTSPVDAQKGARVKNDEDQEDAA